MNEEAENIIRTETFLKNARILCVCDHGNSRSKYMARALSSMGYQHTRVLGIQDASSSKEKIDQIKEHKLIICASKTVKSSLEKFISQQSEQLPVTILNIEIHENLHAKLYYYLRGAKGNIDTEVQEIITQLKELGFN